MVDTSAPVEAPVTPEAPVTGAAPVEAPVTEPTTGEAPVTEAPVTETPVVEPPAHRYHDRLTKAFPGREFKSSEDYDTATDEHLDTLEKYHSRGQESNQALMDIFDSSPEIAEVLKDMKAGATFREALVRHYDPADLVANDGDPDHEGWTANKTARQDKFASDEEFRNSFSTNMDESNKTILAFAEENKMDPAQAESLFSNLENVLEEVASGKVTKETLGWLMKGINFEAKVAEAAETGEIKGANQKIVQERKAVEETTTGDNLPHPDASNDTPAEPKKKGYFETIADHEAKKKIL